MTIDTCAIQVEPPDTTIQALKNQVKILKLNAEMYRAVSEHFEPQIKALVLELIPDYTIHGTLHEFVYGYRQKAEAEEKAIRELEAAIQTLEDK